MKEASKAAVLADQGWIDTLASAVGTVLPVEVHSFYRDRRDEAVAWLYT